MSITETRISNVHYFTLKIELFLIFKISVSFDSFEKLLSGQIMLISSCPRVITKC